MSNDSELILMLAVMALFGIGVVCSLLGRLLNHARHIETMLSSFPGVQKTETLDPDVEEKIKAGKINDAIVLYRSIHDVPLREAELVVRRFVRETT